MIILRRNTWVNLVIVLVISSIEVGRYVYAQSPLPTIVGELTYIKIDDVQPSQYIQISATGTSTVEIANDQCSALSPSGALVAISSPQASDLTVTRMNTGEIIFSQTWATNWQPCRFNWRSDEVLLFLSDEGEYELLNVFTRTSRSVNETEMFRPTQTSPLPNRVPLEPVLYSPNGEYALYSQCFNNDFSLEGDYCLGDSQVVVYGRRTQQIVEVLQNTNRFVLGENEVDIGRFPPNPPSIFWSSTGQYILYTPISGRQLRLYDVTEDRYHDLEYSLTGREQFISLFAEVNWTADDSRVGFWIFDGAEVDNRILQVFVAHDLATQTTQVLREQPYELKARWMWSPEGQTIALVTRAGDLVVIDIETRQTTVIDQGVYSIWSWQ